MKYAFLQCWLVWTCCKKDINNENNICTRSDSYLVSGESLEMVTGLYGSMKECMAAAAEQKIPGNCYPVDKATHTNNNEIPADFKTAPNKIRFHFICQQWQGFVHP